MKINFPQKVNYGRSQPGCRSAEYFAESINSKDVFQAINCMSLSEIDKRLTESVHQQECKIKWAVNRLILDYVETSMWKLIQNCH